MLTISERNNEHQTRFNFHRHIPHISRIQRILANRTRRTNLYNIAVSELRIRINTFSVIIDLTLVVIRRGSLTRNNLWLVTRLFLLEKTVQRIFVYFIALVPHFESLRLFSNCCCTNSRCNHIRCAFLKFLIGNCLRIFTVAFIIYLTFENCFFHVITPICKFFLLNQLRYQ